MKMIYEAPEIFDSIWQHVNCLLGVSVGVDLDGDGKPDIDIGVGV